MENSSNIYRRLTLKERGHFSNHFSLFPVKEIQIREDMLIIKRGFKKYYYRWSDLNKIKLIKRKRFKPYGKGTGAYINQKLCVIVTPDIQFKFDISGQFPDFKNGKKLLSELSKKIQVVEESVE